jgi:hypothetical protein
VSLPPNAFTEDVDIIDRLRVVFAYHWHNNYDAEIESNSIFELLEKRHNQNLGNA